MAFRAPNYTNTPNEIFDKWLPHLKLNEMRVLLVIVRQTFGWHKQRDRISISQLSQKCGIDRSNANEAVNSLIDKGLIIKKVTGSVGRQKTYYEINFIEDSNNSDQWQITTPPVVNYHPTKETLTKETTSSKEEDIRAITALSLKSRKKKPEEKEAKADRVFITPSQEATLLKKANNDLNLVKKWYDALNDWKIGKDIVGGNDYLSICKWVIEAVEKNQIYKREDLEVSNKEWIKKFHVLEMLERKNEVSVCREYVQFNKIGDSPCVNYKDPKFKNLCEHYLRKIGAI